MSIPDSVSFIYIHGFNSSPQSFKAKQLARWFSARGQAHRLAIPELNHSPQRAIDQLKPLVEAADSVALIGSSLGGFYATWLTEAYGHVRSVLVNPAVAPHRLLEKMLGETENYYTGERYLLTPAHMTQLEALFLPSLQCSDRLLLLQQKGDETLDYRDAVAYYRDSMQLVQPGGSHAFDNFESQFELIMEFAAGKTNPERLTYIPGSLGD